MDSALLPDEWFNAFRGWVREHLAINFTESQRRNLSSGIGRAMQETGATSYENYWNLLMQQPPIELERLARLLTVPETYFFRDAFQMKALRTTILPWLIAARNAERSLSIWSAGCSTGEEPYTLAILLADLLPSDWKLSIFGSDVNGAVLEKARRGIYSARSVREVPPALREKFFTESDDQYRLIDSIRSRVEFVMLNLIAPKYPAPFNRADMFDLIICRNVLIYFTDPHSSTVVRRLEHTLAPTGFLLTGQAEPVNRLSQTLRAEMVGETITYRKGLRSAPVVTALPTPPTVTAPAIAPPVTPSPAPPARVKHTLPVVLPTLRRRPDVPKVPVSLYDQSINVANDGQWEKAYDLCQQAIREAPMDYCNHQLLGLIQEAQGDFKAARDSLRRAIYLKPDAILAHFYLASLYHQLNDAREGRAWAILYRLLESRVPDELVEDSAAMTIAYLRSLVEPMMLNHNAASH